MKIWFDVLTPKQLLFFEPIIRKLQKNHELLCTSRNYREVVELSKIRNLNLILVGKHGGYDKIQKLCSSIRRMSFLLPMVTRFNPKLTVSFCSPEATRISFGLGIHHIAFCDSPHSEAVMKLTVPLVDKLLIPWIIPKKEFLKFGISKNKIITYKAIDASIILKQRARKKLKFDLPLKKKTILIRPEESEASYIIKNDKRTIRIIREITREFENFNILVLPRYHSQISYLKYELGKSVILMDKVVESVNLFRITDLFIGSGGTMTAEAALMGIPTISFNKNPNYVEKYLQKNGLMKRSTTPLKIVSEAKKILNLDSKNYKRNSLKVLNSMENPFKILLAQINLLKK